MVFTHDRFQAKMSPYLKIEKPIKEVCLDAGTAIKISFFI
jgi:hypothetical protein